MFEKDCQYMNKTTSIMNDIKIAMNLINIAPIDSNYEVAVVTQLFKLIQQHVFRYLPNALLYSATRLRRILSRFFVLESCSNITIASMALI